jgi:septal ring factor EnvC (AmiA/AmiB activator)
VEAFQNELENERQMRREQLSAPPPPSANRLVTFNRSQNIHSVTPLLFSDSMLEEYQKYIEQLQQSLFEKDNEKNSLNQRLNELELELQKTIDDHTSKLQSIIQERDALIEQERIHSEEQ